MEHWMQIFIISAFCFTSTVIVGFLGFHEIMKYFVHDQTCLKKGNEIRDYYLKLPFPLDFHVYFFNVSNPMEVQSGQTPILKEIGPYCYDLYKERINVIDDDSEDSLTYTPSDRYVFNQTRSGNLSHDDYVTILNPLIVGMVNVVLNESPAFLSIINKAIKAMFGQPNSIYLTAKVRDILFDGLVINCSVTDYSAKAVCSQLKLQVADLKEIDKNVFLYAALRSRNGTLNDRFKILRGIKHYQDLGKVVEYNEKKKINVWPDDECNEFHGTDGWIFPPFLNEEKGIWAFSSDLCRSVQAKYIEDTKFKGIPVRKYYGGFGDQSSNAEDKCYCPTPKTCLKKGVMDLTKCMRFPLFVSLPHFLDADPSYLESVKGLNPNEEDHMLRIYFESMIGVPIEGRKRVQINLQIQPVSKIDLMKNVPEALHPVLWLDEGVSLKGYFLKRISIVFILLTIKDIFRYFFLFGGAGGMIYAVYLYIKNKNETRIIPLYKEGDRQRSSVNNSNSNESYVNHAMSGEELNKY